MKTIPPPIGRGKRRRIPLPAGELPPLDRPIMAAPYGIIAVSERTGELVEHGDTATSILNEQTKWSGIVAPATS